ncbi:MAG: peroxiredoxin [Anaerolineales bacterium]|nr:peroxiredoxin [Anaerolineales bacterium]
MNARKLSIGDPAPDFVLPGDSGRAVRLSEFRGRRVILYFYPKDDTPGCTAQACGFRDQFPRIEEQNAVVLGVSPDGPESHRAFREKHNLPFSLLTDADHRVAESYGAWSGLGIIRSHFVIDEHGNLADIQISVSPSDSVERAAKAVGAGG